MLVTGGIRRGQLFSLTDCASVAGANVGVSAGNVPYRPTNSLSKDQELNNLIKLLLLAALTLALTRGNQILRILLNP